MPGATGGGVDVPGVLWGAEIPGGVGTVGKVGIAGVGLVTGGVSGVFQSGAVPLPGDVLFGGVAAFADGTPPEPPPYYGPSCPYRIITTAAFVNSYTASNPACTAICYGAGPDAECHVF